MVRFRSFEQKSFFWALLVATLALLYLIHHFLQPIFWAALLATLFSSLHKRLCRRLRGHASSSALLVVLLIICSVIVPIVLVASVVLHQASTTIENLSQTPDFDTAEPLRRIEQAIMPAREFLDRVGIDTARLVGGMSSAAVTSGQFIAKRAVTLGQNALLFAVQLMAMLYMLFFFLRDGDRLVERLIHVIPMGDDRERRLVAKFAQVATATIKGTLVVACVQGALGGLAFGLFGIPGPVLWGVVMAVLSIVPVLGPAVVWLPAAFWLGASGETAQAVGLVLFGVFVIGLIDNFLRPILVGHDTRLPDYVVLVATFGGIAMLGASGFVIGPIAAALCIAGWNMFESDFGQAGTTTPTPR